MVDRGLYFIRSKQMHLSLAQAEDFYREHEGRFFFTRLTSFMSSSPISVHIVGGNRAIADWRKMLGPTKVIKTQYELPDSVRGMYGITDTRNVAHGSDSIESALNEINFFFPDFDSLAWLQKELPHFVSNNVEFDSLEDVHKVKSSN